MYLKQLKLYQFKNYEKLNLSFSNKVNCLVGNNGVGKTNILDAIHYLSISKSYFNSFDAQNILRGREEAAVNGEFDLDAQDYKVQCLLSNSSKKRLKIDSKDYKRFADHIGLFPVVMITPSDIVIILGNSDERRKFIDGTISQFDRVYLDDLINYNKVLSHRNRLLKSAREDRTIGPDMFMVWDRQLDSLGKKIFEKRKNFLDSFVPAFHKYYQFISGENETAEMNYQSQLYEIDLLSELEKTLQTDLMRGFTGSGIHKDDFEIKLDEFPVKKFASQGQKKSCIIALKLAQFEFVMNKKGFKPILLLDDVFDKLDDQRVAQLMKLVSDHSFGQIFTTNTSAESVRKIFESISEEADIFEINKNQEARRV